jgi:hypothetical protein
MLWLAGLFFLAMRKVATKIVGKKLWFLPFVFLVLAVFSLAYAPLPFGWGSIAGLIGYVGTWLLGLLGGLFGASGATIAGLLLIVVLIFGMIDLIKDHKPDGAAKTMVFALPVLVLIASSSIAGNVGNFIERVANVGPAVVQSITK